MLLDVAPRSAGARRASRRTPAGAGRTSRRRRRRRPPPRSSAWSASRSSTSRGNTFSPPLTIISSSRPSTNSRPPASKWPTSPVLISPSHDLLAAAAGVALEHHLVGRRRCARSRPRGTSRPSASSSFTTVPERRPPGGARRGAQVLGRGDRGPRHLGRAVEVVEHLAEGVHRARRQLAGQRRAAQRDHPQRSAGRSARSSRRPSSRIRCSITGTSASAVARCWATASQRVLGVEPAAQHERRGERQPEREVREAPRVEHRRGDHRRLARVQRDLREQRGRRLERVGLLARGALGRAGRARGEDHDAPASRPAASGRRGSPRAIRSSSSGSPSAARRRARSRR